MGLLTAGSPPVVAPNPKAVEQSQAVLSLVIDGTVQTYQGEALQWDPAKARTIALVFAGPWYAKRSVHLFLWATESARLQISSRVLPAAVQVDLDATQGVVAKGVRLEVSDAGGTLTEDVRVYLTCEDVSSGAVFIGLDGSHPAMSTRLESRVLPNLPFAVLLATWSLVFAALFAVGVQTGSTGALFAAPALAVLPGILNLLGVPWAKLFNVSHLARWVTNTLPRRAALAWALMGVPAGLMMSYVAFALLVYASYYHRVEAHGLSEEADLAQVAGLLCDYPERLEVRALTVKKLTEANSAATSVNAQLRLIKAVPTSRFLDSCLSGPRVTPLILDTNPAQRDRALIFYASVWWNSIEDLKDFEPAMKEIDRILTSSGTQSDLVALTLAKFEARSIKNQNEHLHCAGTNRSTPACADRRALCAKARDKLVAALDRVTDPADVRTVTYLESRDVAASSYMSKGCVEDGRADADKVVTQLRALVRALPKHEAVLDDLLAQLNFRKYLDSQFEKRPAHQTSQDWQEECKLQPDVCKVLYDTFINDQKQTFFSPDREKRAAEWEGSSIPALKGVELEQVVERLIKKGWKWPL